MLRPEVAARRASWWVLGTMALCALMGGFLSHSARLGIKGLTDDLTGQSPFFAAEAPFVTAIMFLHMITGAVLTLLAVLQLLGPVRRNWPVAHRIGGRVMAGLGLFTAFGGIVYALDRGTTGGRFMDLSSTVYGLMMLAAAGRTCRFARARAYARHRRWGWRFSVLVIASWLYRMHYAIWDRLTGGLWTTPEMTGPFDRFQAWGFYLGYALLLELWFLRERRRSRRPSQARAPAAARSAP